MVSQDQRYVIGLLSGHLGGANDWTRKIAAFLHAEPVITTATDLQGQLAFDEVAKNNHLAIENISVLKQISGALLNGKSIWLQSDLPVTGTEQYPQISFSEQANSAGKVVISDRTQTRLETLPTLYLRPKDLVIGVGCKKSIPFVHLETCFLSFLETYRYACDSIKAMATISRKQAEPAILQLCETYHIPLQIVPDADIRACGNLFEASAFVQQVTGLVFKKKKGYDFDQKKKICGCHLGSQPLRIAAHSFIRRKFSCSQPFMQSGSAPAMFCI